MVVILLYVIRGRGCKIVIMREGLKGNQKLSKNASNKILQHM